MTWVNTGPMHKDNPAWTPTKLKLEEAIFAANKRVYDFEWNVCQSIIDGLNNTVPGDNKKGGAGTIGTKIYRVTNDPKAILKHLENV